MKETEMHEKLTRGKGDPPPPPPSCPPHNWVVSGHIATCSKCGASQNVS